MKEVAGTPPKSTAVTLSRFAPLMYVATPPAGRLQEGPTEVTVGGAKYVKLTGTCTNDPSQIQVYALGDVPPGVVTLTHTEPGVSPVASGLRTTSWLSLSLTIVAGLAPKSTAVAPARPLPVMVTRLPP